MKRVEVSTGLVATSFSSISLVVHDPGVHLESGSQGCVGIICHVVVSHSHIPGGAGAGKSNLDSGWGRLKGS